MCPNATIDGLSTGTLTTDVGPDSNANRHVDSLNARTSGRKKFGMIGDDELANDAEGTDQQMYATFRATLAGEDRLKKKSLLCGCCSIILFTVYHDYGGPVGVLCLFLPPDPPFVWRRNVRFQPLVS